MAEGENVNDIPRKSHLAIAAGMKPLQVPIRKQKTR